VHYTLGTPCFKDFKHAAMAKGWWESHRSSQDGMGI